MFDVTCFDKYGNTVTYLTQWDLNQTLFIEDHGFTTAPQFHFCNKNSEKALVVQSVDKDGVLEVVVPNVLLIEPHTITVYVYLTEGDSSKTVEYIQIPVRQRPQPDSFEYEDNVVLVDVQELANEIMTLNASMSSAEEERVASELNRISNETDRQSAEEARKTAETTRINTEIERIDAENVRKENEDIRVENENVRTSSEQSRVSAETERINKENVRQENESARQTAETDRIDAEADRIEAESNRADAEVERIEAENNRSDAEVTRVSTENERISAETTRQLQEEERQTNTVTAIANAEAATNRANVAAEACEGIIEGTGLIPSTEKGLAGGVASLDENGKVPLEQLPNDISEIATTEKAGIVKPDGTTITVDADGTIHGNASVEVDTELSTESTNPIANKAVADEFEKYLPKSNGTVNGVLKFKRSNEYTGYGQIHQDHNTDTNYGLTLRDYNADGSFVGIRICEAEDKVYYRDKATYQKEILHTGNMASHVLPKTLTENAEIIVPYDYELRIKSQYVEGVETYYDSYFKRAEVNFIGNSLKITPGSTTCGGSLSAANISASNYLSIKGNEALHTGNSAKVSIGTTAPSDTTGKVLFINTSA